MKKISIALIGLALSSPVIAASLTVPAAVASSSTGSQNLTVTNGSGLKFNSFTMTMSKGVSFYATDDTAMVAVGINAKHNSTDKVFGGSTQGGSVAQCTTAGTKNADLAAGVDDTGCNTSGT